MVIVRSVIWRNRNAPTPRAPAPDNARSAMFTARSAMRSRSLLIFTIVATGANRQRPVDASEDFQALFLDLIFFKIDRRIDHQRPR